MQRRDRTLEFEALVAQNKRTIVVKGQPAPGLGNGIKQQTKFMEAACSISRQLALTLDKLGNLAREAKSTNLFDAEEKGRRIQSLLHEVNQEIETMKQRTQILEQLKSNEKSYSKSKHGTAHAQAVVSGIQQRLQQATTKYMSVLETRMSAVKHQSEKRERFPLLSEPSKKKSISDLQAKFNTSLTPFGNSSSTPSSSSTSSIFSTPALNFEPGTYVSKIDEGYSLEGGQNLAVMQGTVNMEEDFMRAREENLQEIARGMQQLQELFRRITTMVASQQESLDVLDMNVREVEVNTSKAYENLVAAMESVRGNRGLVLKIFGVLIVFVIVFFLLFL
eukprot:TRINITY_DN1280_c0_g1_i1.p1 TRINITY_DN1280_c0_g1~~TRINITY_DN1280_c0_g1_i1.p1  ORF type:complete len:335 (-),score=103.61 TRINITY_DN1280_c0_g1_i1:14-1018(-)